MISFKDYHHPKEIILQSIHWPIAYRLSYQDIEELLSERVIKVDHSTLNRWVLYFASLLEAEFHKRKRKPVGRVRLG